MLKRSFLVASAVAFLWVSFNLAFAQTSRRNQARQTRRVRGQVLTSTALPPIRIKFDNAFLYAGSQKFLLNNRARVEQYFFIDADAQRRIKRMYMVEFENYLPGVNGTFNYTPTRTAELAGDSYIINAGIAPAVSAVIKRNPRSDIARAVAFLESRGYRTSESAMYQRLVRVVDDAKRSKFVLLYAEDLGNEGFVPADFRNGGRAAAEREKILRDLSNRAMQGFTILK